MPPVVRYLRSPLLAAVLALPLGASPAAASDLLDLNATDVQLAVHGSTALVTYRAGAPHGMSSRGAPSTRSRPTPASRRFASSTTTRAV